MIFARYGSISLYVQNITTKTDTNINMNEMLNLSVYLIPTFLCRLIRNSQTAQERLDNYIDSSNENSIHDRRTSIRRLKVSCTLLTKKGS